MPRQITNEEDATRKEMSRRYKAQEHDADGYNDWGQYTAHVVHCQRQEIARLRALLQRRNVEPGEWDEPFQGWAIG